MSHSALPDYEKLGVFYLGRELDPSTGQSTTRPVLYDAKDLTTHAICVGMTGSGKTGLCICLLEEAAIDGLPALIVDVKGDMANLLLQFPELRAQDFEPWIDPGEAAREGRSVPEHAQKTADLWKKGLAGFDQDQARIQRLKDSAEFALYTPGSNAGRPLALLRSFAAPGPAIAGDREALADRINGAVQSLLGLHGLDPDPVRSKPAILLGNLLDYHWRQGQDLSLGDLIREIQTPPFERLGVLDLESFFPQKERADLAMTLNGLLASPSFGIWLEGDPLDIQSLLYTSTGRPRHSVISIAHLSDQERMFFVTLLLNELLAWMRAQSGTGSLRALFYMDEIFGYFPPSAMPPSKKPMLTLLKQARAFGLGVVLATQNPVDLDYKGLGNTGTWLIGRLQTERDKLRVLDGLEGASTGGGQSFDRATMDRLLSSLGKRMFLLHNVHDAAPVLFQTRWALSYLRGPLDRAQLTRLRQQIEGQAGATVSPAPQGSERSPAPPAKAQAAASKPAAGAASAGTRPLLPAGIPERFLRPNQPAPPGATCVYRPAIAAVVQLRFVAAKAGIDRFESRGLRAPLPTDASAPLWSEAEVFAVQPSGQGGETSAEPCDGEPRAGAEFAASPAMIQREKSWEAWSKELGQWAFQSQALTQWKVAALKLESLPGESQAAFRARATQAARESRDRDVEKLRQKYAPKLQTLRDRERRTLDRVEKEQEQLGSARSESLLSMGTSLLGALLGRKKVTATNARRVGSALTKAGKVSREKADIERAKDELASVREALAELEKEFEVEVRNLEQSFTPGDLQLEEVLIRPRKSDLEVRGLELHWLPYFVTPDGRSSRA
jgi:Helicase HerA, central domain